MNTNKWTPEPWRVYEGRTAITIEPGMLAVIADRRTGAGRGCKVLWYRPDEHSANAARIVACVNSLAGIPDPEAAIKAARKVLAGFNFYGTATTFCCCPMKDNSTDESRHSTQCNDARRALAMLNGGA
jgi:hypothetical protein